MILPDNGKVAVFDDKITEIQGFLKTLSKNRIPYLYYQDELGGDLPTEPIKNIRLVILDLELVTDNLSPSNIVSAIGSRLKKVLAPNTAYFLIYWSEKEEEYRKYFEATFENGLKDYKPLLMKSMNKIEALKSDDPVDYIQNNLLKEFGEISSMHSFLLWESCVNNASGSLTNHLTGIFKKDSYWDKNFKNLLYTLSKSKVGKDLVNDLNDKNRLTSAFEFINTTLVETIESEYNNRINEIEITGIDQGGSGINEEEKIKLNTSFHLIKAPDLQHFISGNIYFKDIDTRGEEMLKFNFKEAQLSEIKKKDPKLVCLDITPTCDYSQRKNFTRVLFGISVDKLFRNEIKNGESKYKNCPVFDIGVQNILLFDYRHFTTYTKDEFENEFKQKPSFRIRNSLLLDIQAHVSNHINRPGVVTIE